MAFLRILILGAEAKKLSNELNLETSQTFWVVSSSSVDESTRIIKDESFDAIVLSDKVENMSASEMASSIRLAGNTSPLFLLGEGDQVPDTIQQIQGASYVPLSIDHQLFLRLLELGARTIE